MLTCAEITELVTDYVERKMPLGDRMRFWMHIGMCKHCRAYLRQMRQTVDVLGKLPLEPIPEDVRGELQERFRTWRK